jgi:hypothetical protein
MDIALATGRPMPVLDPTRMALLSATLMDFVPYALTSRGTGARGTARFVLLGEAGGCYTVALDPHQASGHQASGTDAQPDVTIMADTVELCRVAARRLAPSELDVTVEGDRDLGALVVAGLDALARD